MLGVVAKLTIKPGTNADFEATMKALQAKVRADEPGNKLYALHKTADVNVYVMLERYDDQAALEAHRAAAHFKEIGRKLGDWYARRARARARRGARLHPGRVHVGRRAGAARRGGRRMSLPSRHAGPHLDRCRGPAELGHAARPRHGLQSASAGARGRVPRPPEEQARPLRGPGLHRAERSDLRGRRASSTPGQHLFWRELRDLLPRSQAGHLQAG